MLVLRVAPLPTLPPFVVRRGAKQHGLGRRRADAIASDAAARPGLVQASLAEQTRQRDAQFLVHGEVTTQQSYFPALAVVLVHRTVSVLFIVGRYLVDRAAVHLPVVATDLDPLTPVLLRLLLCTPPVRAAVVLLVRRLRQRGFTGAE